MEVPRFAASFVSTEECITCTMGMLPCKHDGNEREKQRERQRETETETERDRKTDRQTDRQHYKPHISSN